jgi:hypothetical protein
MKYKTYLQGVYIGQSTTKEGARGLVKIFKRAIFNYDRLKYLESRLRKIRNSVFEFENSGANLEKVKQEIAIRRIKNFAVDIPSLKKELARVGK